MADGHVAERGDRGSGADLKAVVDVNRMKPDGIRTVAAHLDREDVVVVAVIDCFRRADGGAAETGTTNNVVLARVDGRECVSPRQFLAVESRQLRRDPSCRRI